MLEATVTKRMLLVRRAVVRSTLGRRYLFNIYLQICVVSDFENCIKTLFGSGYLGF